jgi:hypothetical protein
MPTPSRVSRAHRWWLLAPFVWQLAFVPFVNDVAYRPLSLPFPMVWQMLGILVATVAIAHVYRLDKRADALDPSDESGS